jgi:hypothetical protein
MLRKLLFETTIGEWLLSQLEQKVGLAVVEAKWLASQLASTVTASCEQQDGTTVNTEVARADPCPATAKGRL